MKKIICFFITLIFVVSLVSCNNSLPDNQSVTLSTQNVNNYLSISGQYGKIAITGKGFFGEPIGDSDFTINIYPIVPGQFYATSITLKVSLTSGWDVKSSDPAFSENDGYLTTTIKLPANGIKEEVHSLHITGFSVVNHDNQDVRMEIVSVTGSFVPG